MSKIRVLHCIASIDPDYGGPAAVLRGLCKHQALSDMEPAVLCCSTGNRTRDRENASALQNAAVHQLPVFWKRYFWSPFQSAEIRRLIRGHDLLHVHGVFNGLVFSACAAARSLRMPYLVEPFGTLSSFCLKKSACLKGLSLWLGERRNIEKASSVRFSSEGEMKRAARNFNIRSGFVAAHGLDWDEFAALPPRGGFRRRWKIADSDRVFLFMGRLQPIKGIENFLRAFAEFLSGASRPWRVALVGPGESGYRRALVRAAGRMSGLSEVLFTGPLYGRARLEALVDSDIVFLVSHHENFGLSAAEGMACGKPVLVSNAVDLAPVVCASGSGEAASTTVDGIRTALSKLASREEDWPQMGERARRWARENCSWENTCRILSGVYRGILKGK